MIYVVDYTGNFRHVSLCGCPQGLANKRERPLYIDCVSIDREKNNGDD